MLTHVGPAVLLSPSDTRTAGPPLMTCDGNCSGSWVWKAQDSSTVGFGTPWPPKLKCKISPLESVLVGSPLQAMGSENFCRAELQMWLRHNKARKHSNKSAELCSTVPTITEINLHQLQWPVNIFIAPSAIFIPLTSMFSWPRTQNPPTWVHSMQRNCETENTIMYQYMTVNAQRDHAGLEVLPRSR